MVKLPRIRIPPLGWLRLPLFTSVRGRIIAGFGLLVVILVAVVAGSLWLTREHQDALHQIEKNAGVTDLLQHAQQRHTQGILLLESYLASGDEEIVPEIRSSLSAARDSIAEALLIEDTGNGLTAGIDADDEVARLNDILAAMNASSVTIEHTIVRRERGDTEGAEEGLAVAFPQIIGLSTDIAESIEDELTEVSFRLDQSNDLANLALWLLLIAGAVGTTLSVSASFLIARSILKPLSSLESTAVAVAAGDLEARAQAKGPRELAHLGETLNLMVTTVGQRTQELRLANEKLQQRHRQLLDARAQAATDGLTGLWNHRAFQERVRQEVSHAQANGGNLGLVMIDIDDFKRVNDSLGHQAGDQILRQIATALTDAVGEEQAYRYGGDEFAALLLETDRRKTARVAERLRRDVTKRTASNGTRVTVSLGVASLPDVATSADELIYGADAAMYWAKSMGKNQVGDWGKLLKQSTDGAAPWFAADRGVRAPDVVVALVAALAAKDPTTSAHTERCSWYTATLAREIGLKDDETSIVRLASLLHDVGKLAVPDDILRKPGPLNEEEWAQMKQHPTAALHVLSQIRSIADATPAILHHHEHFDGSGYPDGLAGEDIPIASRILLVTDAFDAMTTDRPYRKAMSIEAAVEELKSNSGSQFDPSIVEAFLRILEREGAQPLGGTALAAAEPAAAGARRRQNGTKTPSR